MSEVSQLWFGSCLSSRLLYGRCSSERYGKCMHLYLSEAPPRTDMVLQRVFRPLPLHCPEPRGFSTNLSKGPFIVIAEMRLINMFSKASRTPISYPIDSCDWCVLDTYITPS